PALTERSVRMGRLSLGLAPAGIDGLLLGAEPALTLALIDDGLVIRPATGHVVDLLPLAVDVALDHALLLRCGGLWREGRGRRGAGWWVRWIDVTGAAPDSQLRCAREVLRLDVLGPRGVGLVIGVLGG